jgi:calcineurin-like phosphoesterase family protein
MIWFTADTHFNHDNILRYCNRPFDTVEEMDEKIISNWNSIVSEDDTIYHLGDFCFGNTNKYLSRLRGNIIRLKGSHDKDIQQPYMIVIEPEGLKDEYGNQRTIVLCHYALRVWEKSHYASYHLFGHSHGKLPPMGLSFDVGIDSNNFFPYSLADIETKMSALKPILDFRKNRKYKNDSI